MFIGDAGKRGNQHDHHQADQPDLGNVQCQAGNQNQRRRTLHQQCGTLAGRALCVVLRGIVGQHGADVVRQQGAVAEPAQFLQQDTGHQASHQHR
ncbi:hypothetical protein D3C73_1425290 [compost metagenome]